MTQTIPLKGKFATLKTNRANGINPMVEILDEDETHITYRGAFGGTVKKRALKSKIVKVIDTDAESD